MPKLTPPVKNAKNGKMRSSNKARLLIKARVKQYGSQHRAAKALHMTQAQLNGMLTGRLKDTPAMKIAIDRADTRARRAAKRAWFGKDDQCSVIDAPATLRAASRALAQAQSMIEMIVKVSEG